MNNKVVIIMVAAACCLIMLSIGGGIATYFMLQPATTSGANGTSGTSGANGISGTSGAGSTPKYFSIKHKDGKCIHPEGGSENPGNQTKLVLHEGCDNNKTKLELTSAGSLKHKSGKCIHPEGDSDNPADNTKLVLYDGCDQPKLKFEFLENGAIKHVYSGKCIQPHVPITIENIFDVRGIVDKMFLNTTMVGGKYNPDNNTQLVLATGCDSPGLKFSQV